MAKIIKVASGYWLNPDNIAFIDESKSGDLKVTFIGGAVLELSEDDAQTLFETLKTYSLIDDAKRG